MKGFLAAARPAAHDAGRESCGTTDIIRALQKAVAVR